MRGISTVVSTMVNETPEIPFVDCIQLYFEPSEAICKPEYTHQVFPKGIPDFNQDIVVRLAPSCRKCTVSFSRKRKLESKSEANDTNEEKANDDNATMSQSDILSQLSVALPEICADSVSDDCAELFPESTVLLDSNDMVMQLVSGSVARDYHHQVQNLALFFIENASNVDIASANEGSWKVLYLFQRYDTKYSLAGYMTLYHFDSPFRKPRAGTIVRICQVVIFPLNQRQGHGARMLNVLYDHFQQDDSVVEINVEDPNPLYTALRLKVDYKHFLETKYSTLDPTTPPTDAEKEDTSTRLKITTHQAELVHEILRLSLIDESDEEVVKRYRLMVKKRLRREHLEDLSGLDSKEKMKAFLAERYEEQLVIFKGAKGSN